MRVKYTNIYGTPITCPSVPQGSVIGPYLFALFMGSLHLPESMNKNDYQIILYAYDIMLIFNLLHTHVSASTYISDWCLRNDLLLNSSKTVQMFIKKARNFVTPDNYENITISDSVKYLGFNLSASFNFNEHFRFTCANVFMFFVLYGQLLAL